MDYLTPKEAAHKLLVSESTVRRMFDVGVLRGWTTTGGHRRIYEASVEEAVSKRTPGITFPPKRQ